MLVFGLLVANFKNGRMGEKQSLECVYKWPIFKSVTFGIFDKFM